MNTDDLCAHFEELAYQRYLDLTLLAGSEGDTVEVLPKEAVCARNPDGTYFVLSMNSAWWGYQAGAGADPAAVQVVVPPLDNAPGGESTQIFSDAAELDITRGVVPLDKVLARGGESAAIFPDISATDRANGRVAVGKIALPTYGTLPWEIVLSYVEAAVGCAPRIDPECSIGHQIVGINFNSLNRIMSALAEPGVAR